MTDSASPAEERPLTRLLGHLALLRDNGYQPMYNGRPSCPFCQNFVDVEETHRPDCILLASVTDDERLEVERLAEAITDVFRVKRWMVVDPDKMRAFGLPAPDDSWYEAIGTALAPAVADRLRR